METKHQKFVFLAILIDYFIYSTWEDMSSDIDV